jgi:hypothetical protein
MTGIWATQTLASSSEHVRTFWNVSSLALRPNTGSKRNAHKQRHASAIRYGETTTGASAGTRAGKSGSTKQKQGRKGCWVPAFDCECGHPTLAAATWCLSGKHDALLQSPIGSWCFTCSVPDCKQRSNISHRRLRDQHAVRVITHDYNPVLVSTIPLLLLWWDPRCSEAHDCVVQAQLRTFSFLQARRMGMDATWQWCLVGVTVGPMAPDFRTHLVVWVDNRNYMASSILWRFIGGFEGVLDNCTSYACAPAAKRAPVHTI